MQIFKEQLKSNSKQFLLLLHGNNSQNIWQLKLKAGEKTLNLIALDVFTIAF